MTDQLHLFGHVPQPRLSRREPMDVYIAVLALRKRGRRVERRGRHEHQVGKRVVCDAQLIQMAARRG